MDRDFYTTGQAAKILKVSDRGVRKMIDRGELEDVPDERGRHRIPQREVHRLLQERREASPAAPGERRGEADTTESLQASQEAAELRARVEGLQRDLGRLEGRLELTAQAESTLREQLDRERELADIDREYLQGQVEAAQEERRRLQAKLEELEASRRPWWRKMFGR
jgi:excisionase family DNA binding protein